MDDYDDQDVLRRTHNTRPGRFWASRRQEREAQKAREERETDEPIA